MHVTVVSPEQAVFDGSADAIVAPAYDGQVGILPRHAPFLTLLGTGALPARQGTASTRFRVAGGFLQVVGGSGGCGGGGGGGGEETAQCVTERSHESRQHRSSSLPMSRNM